MSLDVSVIIINWNTRDILRDCLRSVYGQTRDVAFEVIVVDNASSDGSAEMVKKEFSQVVLIQNDVNCGFAAANNQGMNIAEGRYALLLNPDTVVLDGAVQKTLVYADRHPDIGIVGCQVWENESTIQRTCFMFPSVWNLFLQESGICRLFPRSHFVGRRQMTGWSRKSERDVDVVSGMFMLVRCEAIQQVGVMDEDYFVYAEETDWCYRFWKAGWRCVFTPNARIIHLDGGSKSIDQVSIKMFVQMQKSILFFFKKQHGLVSWMIVRIIFTVSMLSRYLLLSGLSIMRKDSVFLKKSVQSLAALKFHLFGIEPEC